MTTATTAATRVDPNGIFINYYNPASYCQPHVCTGNNMQLDNTAGCWAGFHPQIEVSSTERRRSHPRHGNDPCD